MQSFHKTRELFFFNKQMAEMKANNSKQEKKFDSNYLY